MIMNQEKLFESQRDIAIRKEVSRKTRRQRKFRSRMNYLWDRLQDNWPAKKP